MTADPDEGFLDRGGVDDALASVARRLIPIEALVYMKPARRPPT